MGDVIWEMSLMESDNENVEKIKKDRKKDRKKERKKEIFHLPAVGFEPPTLERQAMMVTTIPRRSPTPYNLWQAAALGNHSHGIQSRAGRIQTFASAIF